MECLKQTIKSKHAQSLFHLPNSFLDYDELEVIIIPIVERKKTKEGNIEAIFNELYEKWRKETRFNSLIGSSSHNCYDEIVNLGMEVVPYIIEKLRKEPSLILMSLIRITGKNPVKDESKGIVKKMAEDWIQWWEAEST
ncbi:MAG: hypothetical protein LBU89_02045 [Fibromonadaceae bacterium]|jgi:hypothetical protein|nr:hypothetical protein [Fibromonadaceae bacterium]